MHRHKAASRQGLQERLFTLVFSGLVYPQIWEDPVIDMEALQLKAGRASRRHRLGRLQRAELRHRRRRAGDRDRPQSRAYRAEQAEADRGPAVCPTMRPSTASSRKADIAAERRGLSYASAAPHLDDATRRYWEGRDQLGRRRIGYFGRNVYRRGLLGGFITAGHLLARRARPRSRAACCTATSLADQRRIL